VGLGARWSPAASFEGSGQAIEFDIFFFTTGQGIAVSGSGLGAAGVSPEGVGSSR